ncbi:membrane protein [Microbacterium phage Zooman]|nr:membrane protein [Microbacterium phage Zooman]
MAHRDCDRLGTVHKTHVIHDAWGELEYCWGDSTEELAKITREREYREAREKIKHERRMAKLDKRERFGAAVILEGVLKALGWLVLGLIVGTVLSMALNAMKPATESAPEPHSFPTKAEGYALCMERGLEFTELPDDQWVCAEPGTVKP